MVDEAWAGGPDFSDVQNVQQGIQFVPQNIKRHARQETKEVVEVKPKTLEDKFKDTILFVGDTWGYGVLALAIAIGVIGRSKILEFVLNPKQAIRKWLFKDERRSK